MHLTFFFLMHFQPFNFFKKYHSILYNSMISFCKDLKKLYLFLLFQSHIFVIVVLYKNNHKKTVFLFIF
jgi:hypothetical protein